MMMDLQKLPQEICEMIIDRTAYRWVYSISGLEFELYYDKPSKLIRLKMDVFDPKLEYGPDWYYDYYSDPSIE